MSDRTKEAIEWIPEGSLVLVPLQWIKDLMTGAAGPTPPPVEVDLRIEEVAAALHLAPSTVRGMCSDGRLSGVYRREGREWRIPRDAVAAYLEDQRQKHQPRSDQLKPGGGRRLLGDWRNRGAANHSTAEYADVDGRDQ